MFLETLGVFIAFFFFVSEGGSHKHLVLANENQILFCLDIASPLVILRIKETCLYKLMYNSGPPHGFSQWAQYLCINMK
jgi:hypothetical protein